MEKNIFVLKRFMSTTLLKNSCAIKRLINQNKYNILTRAIKEKRKVTVTNLMDALEKSLKQA